MAKTTTLYVGLDTDKTHIDIAVAEALPDGEVRYVGKIANDPRSLQRALKRLCREGQSLVVCYEAGPCGYGIHRHLTALGIDCRVVAPSLVPRRAGDRVKTNRRDAESLARLLRAGELTAVWVPDPAHEAMRDLVRARGQAVAALRRCRQHIAGFLLRQEIGYVGKPWTKKHRRWLSGLAFAEPAHRVLWRELLTALDEAQARRDRLSAEIAELVPAWSLAWLVEALQALRGCGLVTAAGLVAEIGDPRRFDSPRQLMAYLGLVPSEHSTGTRQRRYGLTKPALAEAGDRQSAGPHRADRGGLDLRPAGQADAAGRRATRAAGDRRQGPTPSRPALPPAGRPRQAPPGGGRGGGARTARLRLGHRACGRARRGREEPAAALSRRPGHPVPTDRGGRRNFPHPPVQQPGSGPSVRGTLALMRERLRAQTRAQCQAAPRRIHGQVGNQPTYQRWINRRSQARSQTLAPAPIIHLPSGRIAAGADISASWFDNANIRA